MKLIGGDKPAAVEVVEFKRATHFESDGDDDLILAAYLGAAQDVVETAANRPIGARSVQFDVELGAGARWWFPASPVVSLDAVEIVRDGLAVALDLDDIILEMADTEPRLYFRTQLPFAGGSEFLRVRASVGADKGRCRSMCQAIILIAKSWFEAGIAIDEVTEPRLSFGARALIRQMKYLRPQVWG
jgi:hypothetical protein